MKKGDQERQEIADSIREHANRVRTTRNARNPRLAMGNFATDKEWDERFKKHPAILERLNKP